MGYYSMTWYVRSLKKLSSRLRDRVHRTRVISKFKQEREKNVRREIMWYKRRTYQRATGTMTCEQTQQRLVMETRLWFSPTFMHGNQIDLIPPPMCGHYINKDKITPQHSQTHIIKQKDWCFIRLKDEIETDHQSFHRINPIGLD